MDSKNIVQIASFTARCAFGYRTVYSASKFAGNGFYNSLSAELAEENVRVTSVYPGFVRTNIAKNALVSTGTAESTPAAAATQTAGSAAETPTGTGSKRFGKDDPMIANGLPVEAVVDRILAAAAFGDAEDDVSNTLWMDAQIALCAVSSSWHRFLGRWNYAKSKAACTAQAHSGST